MMGQDVLFLCQKFITVVVFRYQKKHVVSCCQTEMVNIYRYIYIHSICLDIYIYSKSWRYQTDLLVKQLDFMKFMFA